MMEFERLSMKLFADFLRNFKIHAVENSIHLNLSNGKICDYSIYNLLRFLDTFSFYELITQKLFSRIFLSSV